MRLLYFIRDPYPSFRSDVLVLFGRQLPALDVHSDIVATRDPAVPLPHPVWPAGLELVSPRTGSALSRAVKGLLADLRALRGASQYDTVLVRDKIVTAALAMLWAPGRVMYWMSFPFPEEDRVRAALPGCGAAKRLALRLRSSISGALLYRFVVPRARHVFVQSDRMLETVAAASGRTGGMSAVPMGIDEERLASAPPVARRRQPGQPMILGYLGALDRVRRIDFLLQVAAELRRVAPDFDFRLRLVGGASQPEEFEWLLGCIQAMNLGPVVETTGLLSAAQAWQALLGVDVGLSAIPRGEVFDVSSPTKAVEYLAAGVPVVVNDIPDQAYLVRNTGAGLCVPMEVAQFADAVLRLRDDYDGFADRALQARPWIRSERGYQGIAQRVAKVMLGKESQ